MTIPASRPTPRDPTAPASPPGSGDFSSWLRDVMGRQGLSAGTLARRIGAPPLRVSGWILGSRNPEPGEVFVLADALGVNAADVQAALRRSGAG